MKRCRLILLYALSGVLCWPFIAVANDGRVTGIGGRWRFLDDENTSVRMLRENIKINVRSDLVYEVAAEFHFHNDGSATTVRMGFPEGVSSGTFEDKSNFHSFKSWVDGRRVQVQRVANPDDAESYSAFWIKTVNFGKNQARRVRVEYSAPPGHSHSRHYLAWCPYDFTGGNWKGKVDKTSLLINFDAPGTHVVAGVLDKPLAWHRKGNRFSYAWHNWQAQGRLNFYFMSTLPHWLTMPESEPPYYQVPWQHVATVSQGIQQPLHTRFDWLPPAVLRDGVTFIRLRDLKRWWDTKADETSTARLNWNQERKTATLQVGAHTFRFTKDQKHLTVDNENVAVSKAPFIARDAFKREYLYAPLAPIIDALGGEVVVDAKAHRVQFSAPKG